jgi:hypothetical protein
LELVDNYQLIELLKEFKENVAWIYEDSKGISLDAPPSSLMDSTASPKVKTTKGEVGVCFVACNTSRVEGRARAPGWTRKIDNKFNYSNKPVQTKQPFG